MRRLRWMILITLALGAQGQLVSGQTISTQCLSIVDRSFQRVSTEKLNLYEVNSDYFLQAEFQKKCELSKIDISPKYFWDYLNPQWEEPGHLVSLSDDQYTQLLAKIDQIKSLGSLVRRGQVGTVTNATLWLVDMYDKAYVERRLRDSVVEQDQPNKVTSFSVYFIRSVDGKVSDKSRTGLSDTDKRTRLKIDGRWYWVDETEYGKALIGRQGVFRAAGPVG
jgi:hypothetical protein